MLIFRQFLNGSFGRLMIASALLLVAPAVYAQDGQTESSDIPDVPPSVNDYSLPPGPNSPAPVNPREGPGDDENPGSSPAAAPVTPDRTPTAPATSPANPPDRSDSANRQAAPNNPPAIPGRSPRATEPRSRPDETRPDISESASEADRPVLPEVDFPTTEKPEDGRDVRPVPSSAPKDQPASWNPVIIGLGLLVFLTGGGLLFWRRTRVGPMPSVRDDNFTNVTGVAEPHLETEPNHAKEAIIPSSNGNVTSKIAPLSPQPARDTNKIIQPNDALRINFVAENISMTLINAVLGYRISLTNDSEEELCGLKLRAMMTQASGESSTKTPMLPEEALHHLPKLAPGRTEVFTGELRLPFTAINPIQVNGQALLIPLAHFGIEYVKENGQSESWTASYIIGQEHQPQRAKMAPFRLDMGPRRIGSVGHRPIALAY